MYGELLKDPITKIRFLYNGSYGVATDSNGLYYMRARYYNPDIKRFINQDIKVGDIGSSQSLNRYAYCEGSPVSMVDPFGLCGEDANDQGEKSKYEKWHNFLGTAGIFWDGFDLINGALYAAEGDYVNAAISFACGVPAVGTVIAGVAKMSKAAKAMKTASRIADLCKAAGKVGNTAAGMKAVYDTYQTAQRECKTTTGKIAYIAGTLLTGYAAGKAASWGANKLKNLANKALNKALPKLKTAVQEGAGKLASKISKGLGSSSSGHMNRNRGYVVNPFYKGGKTTGINSNKPLYRVMSEAELDAVKSTGKLRGGRTGTTYFTDSYFKNANKAKSRLALPEKPSYIVEFEITNNPNILGGTKVQSAFGEKGGGREYFTDDVIEVTILNYQKMIGGN